MTKSRMITPPQRIVRAAYVPLTKSRSRVADRPRLHVHHRQRVRRVDVEHDRDQQQHARDPEHGLVSGSIGAPEIAQPFRVVDSDASEPRYSFRFPAMWAKIQPKRITPVMAMTAFLPIAER